MVFRNHKSRSFRVRRGFPQKPVLAPILPSLFINVFSASLPFSVSCFLYADDLAIWSSSSSLVTNAVEATQGSLVPLDRWCEYRCLPLNLCKCEASFFLINPHQANLQPQLFLFNSRLCFNRTSTFLGVTFDRTLYFSKHVFLIESKLFYHLKALKCFSASSLCSKESLSLLYKVFLRPLLTYASRAWFPFPSFTNFTKLERLHRPAICAISGYLSSSPIPLLLPEASLPPLRVTLGHFFVSFYERAFASQTPFPI